MFQKTQFTISKIISKIKLKLKPPCQENQIGRQYDSSRLKHPVIKNEFVLKLIKQIPSIRVQKKYLKI